MTAPQNADELVQAIKEAADHGSCWEPEHPQYIEGRFYLTPEQWAAIRREWPLRPGFNDTQAVWGIPVDVIKPNEQVKLPSGKILAYSAVMEAFYVFDAAVASDAGLRPSRRFGSATSGNGAL